MNTNPTGQAQSGIERLQAALEAGPTSAVYTHPRDDNKWRENEAFAWACDPDTIRALLVDALRYRWLRDVHAHHYTVTRYVGGATIPRINGDVLDAAMDAAMQQEPAR